MGSSWRWGVVLRLGLLAGGADGLGLLLSQTRYYAVSAVAAGILVLLMLDFLRHTSSSDRELARVSWSIDRPFFAATTRISRWPWPSPARSSAYGTAASSPKASVPGCRP